MTDYQAHVVAAIVELLDMDNGDHISGETTLEADLGVDSGLLLELFMGLEERIPDLVVDPGELTPEHFSTVASLSSFVELCMKTEEKAA